MDFDCIDGYIFCETKETTSERVSFGFSIGVLQPHTRSPNGRFPNDDSSGSQMMHILAFAIEKS